MKKYFKTYLIIWLILFLLFNVICFITPNQIGEYNKFDGVFWVGYIGIIISFIGQLICSFNAFNTENKTKFFYNIPIIQISYFGLIISIIVGMLCMLVPDLPKWVGIIICLVVLSFITIAILKAKTSSDIIEKIDSKIKNQTNFIKNITVDAEILINKSKNEENIKICKNIYEALKYSDPMSCEGLIEIENQIKMKFNEFSISVENNSEKIESLSNELIDLINNRNKKCKLMK